MKDLEKFRELPTSSQIAVISWAAGTLLFAMAFVFPREDGLIVVGIIYIVIAGIINGILLLFLLGKLLSDNENKQYYLTQIAILLANIPIAILYAYFIITSYLTISNNF